MSSEGTTQVTERSPRRTFKFTGSAERTTGWLVTLALIFGVILPLLMLFVGVIIDGRPLDALQSSLTLDNILGLTQPYVISALINSLVVGLAVTVGATILGVLLSVVLIRTNMPGSSLLLNLSLVTIYLPPFVGAIGWTVLSSPEVGYLSRYVPGYDFNIYSITGIIWVMILHGVPLVMLIVIPALQKIDGSLDEAAAIFGATPRLVISQITIPIIRPAVLGAALLVFVSAISQLGVPLVLGYPIGEMVITTRIYGDVATFPANYNSAATLSVLLLITTAIALSLQRRLITRDRFVTTGGKGARHVRLSLGTLRYVVAAIVLSYVLLAVVLPVTAMIVSSLFPYYSTDLSTPKSLSNYGYVLFEHPEAVRSVINSLGLAIGSGVLGALLASLVRYLNSVRRPRLVNLLTARLAMMPLAIPHLVLAVGMLWAWIALGISTSTILTLLVAYVVVFLPYALQAVESRFVQLSPELSESSRVFGAGWFGTYRQVLLPLLRPGMLSGGFLIGVHAFRELTASILLVAPGTAVMSVVIYDVFSEGSYSTLFALAVLQILLTLLIVGVAGLFGVRLHHSGRVTAP